MKKTRWEHANDSFRQQVRMFMAATGMNIEQIAAACNVSRGSMYNYMRNCSHMEKVTERYLTMLFERHGLCYDPALTTNGGAGR